MRQSKRAQVLQELDAIRDRYGDAAVFSAILQRWWPDLSTAKLEDALRIAREEERYGNI